MFHYASVLAELVALSSAAIEQIAEHLEHSEISSAAHCHLKRCGTLQEFASPCVTNTVFRRLSDYVCQLRRNETVLVTSGEVASHSDLNVTAEPTPHPLAHIVEREKKRVGFDYNAEPDPKKLI